MDSACTDNLLHDHHKSLPSITVNPIHSPLTVYYPNNTQCTSTSSGFLTANNIVAPVHFMPTDCLKRPLLSTGVFTNVGCTANYDNTSCSVSTSNGEGCIVGTKHRHDRLWTVDLKTINPHGAPSMPAPSKLDAEWPRRMRHDTPVVMPSRHTPMLLSRTTPTTPSSFPPLAPRPPLLSSIVGSAALAFRTRTVHETAHYFQLLLGDRPTWTIERALRKGWMRPDEGWPAPTATQYVTHVTNNIAIHKGHLDELRTGVGSTRPKSAKSSPKPSITTEPSPEEIEPISPDGEPGQPLEDVYITMRERPAVSVRDDTMFADMKGPYKTPSHLHQTHDMIALIGGYVIAEPCAGPSAASQLRAFKAIQDHITDHCVQLPKRYIRVDVGVPAAVRQYFEAKHAGAPNMRMEYVPINRHQTNEAEYAIKHFERAQLSAMARAGEGFPADYWNELRPRICFGLNHTRPAQCNKEMSAYEWFHGKNYDFKAHPLVPVACLVARQVDRSNRGSNGYKAAHAFVLGPSERTYRGHRILVRDKAGKWDAHQHEVQISLLLPASVQLPRITPVDEVRLAVQDLTKVIRRVDINAMRAREGFEPLQPLGHSLLQAAQELNHSLANVPPSPPTLLSTAPEQRVVAPALAAVPSQRVVATSPPVPVLAPRVAIKSQPRNERPARTARVPDYKQITRANIAVTKHQASYTAAIPSSTGTSWYPAVAASRPSDPKDLKHFIFLRDDTALPQPVPPVKVPQQPARPRPPVKTPHRRWTTPSGIRYVPTTASPSIPRPARIPMPRAPIKPTVLPHSSKASSPPFALLTTALIALAAATTVAGCQKLAPRMSFSSPDPSTLVDPPLLQRVLSGDVLTPREIAAWRAWVQQCNDKVSDTVIDDDEFFIPCDPPPAMANHVLNLNPDGSPITWATVIKGDHGTEWLRSMTTEFDRLFDLKCWHAIFRHELPPGIVPTYLSKAVREKLKTPDNDQPYIERRVRGALGGDRVWSEGITRCNTAEIDVIKAFLNSVVSDNSDFFTLDIANFYLGTPLPKGQEAYVKVPAHLFSDDILDRRHLRQYIHDGHIILCATQAMYGLRNAGRLSKEYLDRLLSARGYYEDTLVPCLYRHISNGVTFVLVVDDFAIKHTGPDSKQHLIDTLTNAGYSLTIDHKGKKFVGLTIDYNRRERYLEISMPEYVPKILARFSHRTFYPSASPITYVAPIYGAGAQLIVDTDDSTLISDDDYREGQVLVGMGLWYARMISSPTLTAINIISTDLSARRSSIHGKIDRYLGYLLHNPSHVVRFYASDVQYRVFSDVSHNSVSRGRSRAGGFGFFGWKDSSSSNPRLNGGAFNMCSVLDVVTSSACEGEYGAAYMVARNAVWMRVIARALGHPQGPTPIYCDNTCAVGLATDTLKTAKTKAIDLRFHWLRDRVRQGQFKVLWIATDDNIADFFTKALPVHEHIRRTQQLVVNPTIHNTKRADRSSKWREYLKPRL